MNSTPTLLRDSAPVYAGVDLGGTSIHAAAVRQGHVLSEIGAKTPRDASPADVLGLIADLVEELRDGLGRDAPLQGVCVGAPGAVDSEAGVVRNAPNLGWSNVRVARDLSGLLQLPVVVENDVTIGAIGEHRYGAGRGSSSLVAIFVGTGVGGAILLDGTPVRGFRGAAGELGHLIAVPDGRICGCGRAGCFEAYASRTAMEEILMERVREGRPSVVPGIMQEKEKTRMSSSVVEAALDEGDPLMTEVLAEVQSHLASLVANVVNTLDPEVVVFGGGLVARLGDRFVDPIAREARRGFLQQEGAEEIRVVPGTLGDQAGTIGAAGVAAERLAEVG